MLYQIDELSHSQFQAPDKVVDCVFVRVRFWDTQADFDAGNPEKRANDFLMQLKLEHNGVARDNTRIIHDHIWQYWVNAEAKGYRADDRSRSIQRDRSDPTGVLARPEVARLENLRFTRTTRGETPTERTGAAPRSR